VAVNLVSLDDRLTTRASLRLPAAAAYFERIAGQSRVAAEHGGTQWARHEAFAAVA
jgi:predicted alternative tryptophan synthase beta-subunit